MDETSAKRGQEDVSLFVDLDWTRPGPGCCLRPRAAKQRPELKGTRYAWLKRPANLTRRQAATLAGLTPASVGLRTARAYRWRLAFDAFFEQPVELAEADLERWYQGAIRSRLEPTVAFAPMIGEHWEGVLRWHWTKINNGVLEGSNSLVQASKRRARGYRNKQNLIAMIYLIAEAGLTRVTPKVLNNAAGSIVGMATAPALPAEADKPLIGCMMFGVTTPTVLRASAYFEARGYDAMVNHAVGSGGRSMEELIADGYIVGMLDITTHEIADELFGGVLGAGPDRLTAAGRRGIPQVVSVGGLDLINFGARDTLAKKYEEEEHLPGRAIYVHDPTVTCAGVSVGEAEQLGRELATKLSSATGPTALCIPLRGWGAVDLAAPDKALGWAGPGPGPVWWADAEHPEWSLRNRHLIGGLVEKFDFDKPNLDVLAVDRHMNDPAFADFMAELLEEMVAGRWTKGSHHDRPEVIPLTRQGLASLSA